MASVYYSFTDWSGLGPATFVGLANYEALFSDEAVREAVVHNGIWLVIALTVPISLSLLGAFLLSQVERLQVLFRLLFFIPVVLATVVVAAIWQQLLDPTQGVGEVLRSLGLPVPEELAFFADTRLALYSIAFVAVWAGWGFLVVIFLSAMQGVDRELYDAAKIDGASRLREFWHVTLPGIRPTLVFMLLMTVVWSFTVFDFIWIITRGGPAGSSEVVTTLAYKEAFQDFEAGYAASMGLGLSLISALVVLGFFLLRRMGWEI